MKKSGGNQEIYFKIMIFSFFIIGIMFVQDAFAQNENLFVSAENPVFDNFFAGPQVIEVVVIDENFDDTKEIKGEPEVSVNGKDLRMVQAVDGNWYAYFADVRHSLIADFTATTTNTSGQGLDFGVFCGSNSGDFLLSDPNFNLAIDISETSGIALQDPGDVSGFVQGVNEVPTTSYLDNVLCSNMANNSFAIDDMNVIREQKAINEGNGPPTGQIGLDIDFWPFIQLFPFNPTGNVVVQYNKGGGVQTTTLTYDITPDTRTINLDKEGYLPGDNVLVTIGDYELNIDPTDEDSWTFGTQETSNTFSTNYQVFDKNGNQAGDIETGGTINIQHFLPDIMFGDNGILIIEVDPLNSGTNPITLQDNNDSVLELDSTNPSPDHNVIYDWTTKGFNDGVNLALSPSSVPITFSESGPNTGIFVSFDDSNVSNLKLTNSAPAGWVGIIDYNLSSLAITVVEPEPPQEESKKSCESLEKENPSEKKGKAQGKEIAKIKNNCN